MSDKVYRWGPLLAGLIMLVLALAIGGASAAPAPVNSGTDYPGPFVMMKVPALCAFPQQDLRYYYDLAPAGTAFLRTGAHGHGGNLRCIYVATDGATYAKGDHPYGKWLVFNENGVGLLIGPKGIDVSYVNCALPGYRFPFPVGNGQPNDCGESWVTSEAGTYRYQQPPDVGQTMYPPTLP